jgi:hypothetical protein
MIGVGDAVVKAWRAVFDFIKSGWNATVGGFGFSIPKWVPGVGGNSFHIPSMHTGGVVGGPAGSDQLRMLQAGETVLPAGAGGGVNVYVAGSVITSRDLGRIVADAIRGNALIGVT